MCMCRLFT